MRLPRVSVLAGLLVILLVAPLGSSQARAAPDSFADLAQRLSPAVVNVSTTQTISRSVMPDMPFPPGSPFDEFFREFGENGASPGRPRRVTSLGSGFVIDPLGIIATNNHVIDGADEVQVTFSDGTSYPAKVLGKDDLTDVALLKITAPKPLPYVKFGSSDKARVGDWVVAIGNPFGLGGTVTAGIISGFDRDIQAGPYDDFIQTDAAINRGNSGGPLFNMDGEVIGINTAIISQTGVSIGVGFAIPSNIASNVISQLRQYGETRRGWIGVRIQSVSPDLAEGLGVDKATGALVAEITPGGPAEKAGLQAGDLIVRFDGKDVSTMRSLPRLVAETAIGRTVPIEVIRNGQRKTFSVKVGRLDEKQLSQNDDTQGPSRAPVAPSNNSVLGLQLAPLSPLLRQRYQIADNVSGVVVTGIAPSSPAVGQLTPGDVITEVGQSRVRSPDEVEKHIKNAKQGDKKVVLVMVNRRGAARFEGIRLSN